MARDGARVSLSDEALELMRAVRVDCVLAAPTLANLDADPELIANRLVARRGHFASRQILESQLRTLESLEPDENGIVCPATLPVAEIAHRVVAATGMPTR